MLLDQIYLSTLEPHEAAFECRQSCVHIWLIIRTSTQGYQKIRLNQSGNVSFRLVLCIFTAHIRAFMKLKQFPISTSAHSYLLGGILVEQEQCPGPSSECVNYSLTSAPAFMRFFRWI